MKTKEKDLFGEEIPTVYFKSATLTVNEGWMQMDCGKSSVDNNRYVVTTHQLKSSEVPTECCDAKSFSELVAKLLNQYYNKK